MPEPAAKLDFTEDEEQTNRIRTDDEEAHEVQMNASMHEEENDRSESDDQLEQFVEEPFNKPIVNQNLLLNKNRHVAKNPTFQTKTGLQEPVTPALIKRKQFKPWFNSPTDSCLSPCTQKIFKPKKPI